MALTLTITDVGRAALIAQGGTNAVQITACGVSATVVDPKSSMTALPGETKRIATISGQAVAADVIHLIVRDESSDVFTIRSLALYLSDGTLFAIYGQAAAVLEKAASSVMLLAVDITFADIAASQITFGSTNFLNPPATTVTQGVVELATDAEAIALTDAVRALTPKNMAAIFTAANVLSRMLQIDGSGSGLDADLLDGRQGAEFALLSGAKFSGGVTAPTVSVAGATSELLLFDRASPTDAQRPFSAYVLNDLFRLLSRVTALDVLTISTAGDTEVAGAFSCTGIATVRKNNSDANLSIHSFGNLGRRWTLSSLVSGSMSIGTDENRNRLVISPVGSLARGTATLWDAGNDGAGSGLDADLLDGRDGAEFALLAGAKFVGAISAPSGSIGGVTVDDSGTILAGVGSGSVHTLARAAAQGGDLLSVFSSTLGKPSVFVQAGANTAWSNASAALYVAANTTTGRSINTAGSINASGADFAEYMQKADGCGPIAAGAVCGVDINGELVTRWADARSFVVKSDQPGFVGNDNYGAHLGERPVEPTDETADDWDAAHAAYMADLATFEAALEAARENVDRIAFCGQVPVEVSGAFTVGDYIVAAPDGDAIKAVAMNAATISFDQYRARIGKVWAVRDDRAWIDVQHG